ncbi:hypothetical protein SRHO_G00100930 [Serrasalmus rhombeus]
MELLLPLNLLFQHLRPASSTSQSNDFSILLYITVFQISRPLALQTQSLTLGVGIFRHVTIRLRFRGCDAIIKRLSIQHFCFLTV